MWSWGCFVLTHSSLIATSSPVEMFVPLKPTRFTLNAYAQTIYDNLQMCSYIGQTIMNPTELLRLYNRFKLIGFYSHLPLGIKLKSICSFVEKSKVNDYLSRCLQTIRFQSSYQDDTCFQHVVPSLNPPKSKIYQIKMESVERSLPPSWKSTNESTATKLLALCVELVKIVKNIFFYPWARSLRPETPF